VGIEHDNDALGWLLGIFDRRAEDSSWYYSNDDLLDFVPVMLMSFGFEPSTLPSKLQKLMADFADRAGVTPEMSPPQTERAVRAHLMRNPLNQELVFEFNRGVKEERVTRGNEDVAEAFAKYLADSDRTITDLFSSKEERPPKGTVASGPMAMFLLRDD